MTLHLGNVPASSTLYIPFATYGKTNGESITLTGLAVTDIEIYKNGSATQRASDNGYALLDTDGIDFDGITGIHGFSIDLSDNSDAGFYSVGGFYWVVVSSVTVDGQMVNFVAATFRIVAAEAISGKPKVDVDGWLGTTAATPTVAGVPEVDLTHWRGTATPAEHTAGYPIVTIKDGTGTGEINTNAGAVALVDLVTDITTKTGYRLSATGVDDIWDEAQSGHATAGTFGRFLDAQVANVEADTQDIQSRLPAALVSGRIDASVGAMAAGVVTAAAIATGAIDADALAADVVNDIWMGSTLTESYAADGAAFTPAQALYEICQTLSEFAISGTTITVKKRDGSTTAATFTLDSATDPTSRTRAT